MISLNLEHVSDIGKSRTSPANISGKYACTKKEQALFVSKKQRIVCHSINIPPSFEQDVPTIFGSRVYNFLRQGYHHSSRKSCSAMNTDTRSELRASSPASRPSSSPCRGRGTSAFVACNWFFELQPQSMGGLGLGFASSLRCVLTNSTRSKIYQLLHESTCTRDGAYSSCCMRDGASSCCGGGSAQP